MEDDFPFSASNKCQCVIIDQTTGLFMFKEIV